MWRRAGTDLLSFRPFGALLVRRVQFHFRRLRRAGKEQSMSIRPWQLPAKCASRAGGSRWEREEACFERCGRVRAVRRACGMAWRKAGEDRIAQARR